MTSSVIDPDAAPVRLVDEPIEVLQRAVARMDVLVVRDVVAVVAQRRRDRTAAARGELMPRLCR